jgi:hypothetical protein
VNCEIGNSYSLRARLISHCPVEKPLQLMTKLKCKNNLETILLEIQGRLRQARKHKSEGYPDAAKISTGIEEEQTECQNCYICSVCGENRRILAKTMEFPRSLFGIGIPFQMLCTSNHKWKISRPWNFSPGHGVPREGGQLRRHPPVSPNANGKRSFAGSLGIPETVPF